LKDIDCKSNVIIVRQAKGDKDRVVMLRRALATNLKAHVRAAHAVGG